MIDIIIPSCKEFHELKQLMSMFKVLHDKSDNYNFITTGIKTSAATNRNYGLLQAMESENKYIVMMDDDIGGFYPHFADNLIRPLVQDTKNSIRLISARLLTKEGDLAPMQGSDYKDLNKSLSLAGDHLLSACIAFRKEDVLNKVWFDEDFKGSGFEDTLFCEHLRELHPDRKNFICNDVRLIHYHEMKEQGGENFRFNKSLFLKKCKNINLNKQVSQMGDYCGQQN